MGEAGLTSSRAAINVQAVLTGLTMSAAFIGESAAYTLAKKTLATPAMISKVKPTPASLPIRIVAPYRCHIGCRRRSASRDNFCEKDKDLPRRTMAFIV